MNPLRLLKHKFVKDSATLQLGGLFNAAGNIATSLVLAHVLGAKGQGQYLVAIFLYSLWITVLNLGVIQAAVNQVASHSARGETDKAAGWLAFVAKVYLIGGILLVLSGHLFLPDLGERFLGDRQYGVWASWLAWIPLIEIPRVVAASAFQGTRRMFDLAQTENGQELVRLFLVILGAVATKSPVGPILGMLGASMFGSLIAVEKYSAARRDDGYPLPSVALVLSKVRLVPLRKGLSLGLRIGVLRQVDALCMNTLPPLMVKAITGSPEMVAYFRIARQVMTLPWVFMQGISRTALPAMSELAGVRNKAGFRRAYLKITFMGGGIVASGIVAAVPFVPFVVGMVAPPDYKEPVTTLAWILAVGHVIASFSLATDSFYIAAGQLRAGVIIAAIGFITQPLFALFTYWDPRIGPGWGQVAIMCWVLPHYCYIGWYLRSGSRLRAKPQEA